MTTVVRKDRPVWKQIRRAVFDGRYVVVGVPAGIRTDKGPTVAQVAAWNHYGTEVAGPDGEKRVHVPARPFIDRPLDGRRADVKAFMARIGKGILSGKVSIDLALRLVGEWSRNQVIKAIDAGFPPPNAASTKARKKSSKPLIDSGQLKGSITYMIRGEGKEQ